MVSTAPAQNRDWVPSGQGAERFTYLITFVCYGTWVPGQAGAVDRRHNLFGSRVPAADAVTEERAKSRMQQPAYRLDAGRRSIVLRAMQHVCLHRDWALLAAHVRTNHVHAVVDADQSPEQALNAFKAYASRALNATNLDGHDRRRWARHGSTRYLWTPEDISAAIHYVVCEQGEPMAVLGVTPAP